MRLSTEGEREMERRLQICSGAVKRRGGKTDDSFVAAPREREREREVEAPVVNPWHVLRRFYGNVNAHARAPDGRQT